MNKITQNAALEFKGADSRRFTGYANVKGVIDYASDRSMDGCFKATIAQHKLDDTMPFGLWYHNKSLPQIVSFHEWHEDSKGLFVEGEFLQTDGICEQVYQSAKSKAKPGMSIGYNIPKGKAAWNLRDECRDVYQYNIGEISLCNYDAVNGASRIESVKAKMADSTPLTKAEVRELLKNAYPEMPKAKIEQITAFYNPDCGIKSEEISQIGDYLKGSSLFGG